MIDFRRRENVPSSLLAGTAIIVLAGTLGFMVWAMRNPPNIGKLNDRVRKERLDIQLKTRSSQRILAESKAMVDANTWPGKGDDVAPATNARLSAMAIKRGIKLTGFRPQRTNVAGEISALPILVTVEGPFPSVVELSRDIDSPGTRLALSMVQINASNDQSDSVTATLGIVAYLRPGQAEKEPAKPAGAAPATGGPANRA